MGSRIRENIKHLFQCFCEVVGPQTPDKDAWIIQKYPDSYKDEEVLKSVPKFAYPCDFPNTVVQHYSFVLTSIDSKWTFGFCRHDPKTETALVVLSFLPWHEVFYKLLNHIAQITHGSKSDELRTFLDVIYRSNVPDPGATLQVPFNEGQDNFLCTSPNQFQLPSIPENRNLTEYYNAVDAHNMMVVFASMLYERRIIFISKKLYRLSACVQSANAVIYPMNWQHIFIPVLPTALIDYLLAPMPYLIGVPEPILKRVRKADLGEVVVLDADNNKVDTPFQDLESLPPDVVTALRRQLRNRAALLGDGVSRAFLRALVQLIGGYRDALRFQQGQKITFNQDAFVESRPPSMQPFLRKMLQLQIFQQFIEERLDMLNNGLGFSDEFEMEACNYSDKSSSKLKQQYKEWRYTMKKEGSAFFKNVKSKANPAVKSAVKTVKERGKDVRTVYKGFRSKFRDQSREGLGDSQENDREDKPRSAPTSPTHARRPQTFSLGKPTAMVSFRKEPLRQRKNTASESRSKPYSALSPSSEPGSPESNDKSRCDTPGLQLSPLDMDLMGDLQDVIFRKCSQLFDDEVSPPIDRSLKPVRSLENFKPGSTDTSWWSSPTVPLLLSPTCSPPPATSNGCDLFGAAPFVVSGGGSDGDPVFVVASPSSVDLVWLPPPAQSFTPRTKQKQSQQEGTDLIRLDSTPSEDDFDPLLAKDKKTPDQSPPTRPLLPPGTEGLSNPLYPYFKPANNSFLHSARSGMDQSYPGLSLPPAISPRGYNSQDRDLLKEYGLDFDVLSFPNTLHPARTSVMSHSSPNIGVGQQPNTVGDPFEDLLAFPKQAHLPPQSQWTKFD